MGKHNSSPKLVEIQFVRACTWIREIMHNHGYFCANVIQPKQRIAVNKQEAQEAPKHSNMRQEFSDIRQFLFGYAKLLR